MATYQEYRSSQSIEWTRIDMLIALYAGAIEQIEATLGAMEERNASKALTHRMRAAAFVIAIRSGIDASADELPLKVDQLCEFAQLCLASAEEDKLRSAVQVLKELHAGFTGIREEAQQLEKAGTVPPLSTAPQLDATF